MIRSESEEALPGERRLPPTLSEAVELARGGHRQGAAVSSSSVPHAWLTLLGSGRQDKVACGI